MRLLATALLLCTLSVAALELVTVTFYEQGLTNRTVRHEEGFVSEGHGFYRVDIDVTNAPFYMQATNTVGTLLSHTNLFLAYEKFGTITRDPELTGFDCQSVHDNQSTVGDGRGRNGTLVAPDIVLYAGHYPAEKLTRSITWIGDDGTQDHAYPVEVVRSPDYDLALVKLSEPMTNATPAKVMTEAEWSDVDAGTPLLCFDRFANMSYHEFAPLNGGLNLYADFLLHPDQDHNHGDGDSGCPIFLRVENTTYLVGKVTMISRAERVTQERIDELRGLLSD